MSETNAQAAVKAAKFELGRYGIIPKPIKLVLLFLFSIGIVLFLIQLFNWSIGGWVLADTRYCYILYVTFASGVFL